MVCVVAALKPNDDIRPFTQPIDQLAFTFVTPLGADNRDIRH
jgi:hypothetical protein